MSKIGRKRIPTHDVQVDVHGTEISYKGKNSSGVHSLSPLLRAVVEDKQLFITPVAQDRASWSAEVKEVWGLHRALLATKIAGARANFERHLDIVGLGFKAILKGSNIEFDLGYSDTRVYPIPQGVNVVVSKTGQNVTLQGASNAQLGLVLSEIRRLRPPEPYKGKGIEEKGKVIRRKAGKTKK